MDRKRNLLEETTKELSDNGKSAQDVLWIGTVPGAWSDSTPSKGSWEDFQRLADFTYDAGYGGAEVNTRLVVVGSDWWLERGEYDGSEWWEFKTLPVPAEGATPLRLEDLRRDW